MLHRNFLQPDDQEMITSSLAGLKAEGKTDLIVLFQRVDAALWTIGAIRETGLKTDILGGDSLSPVSFLQRDPKLINGMRVSQFFMPHLDDARASRFVQDFREFSGTDGDHGNAFAYDAIYLVRQAMLNGDSAARASRHISSG